MVQKGKLHSKHRTLKSADNFDLEQFYLCSSQSHFTQKLFGIHLFITSRGFYHKQMQNVRIRGMYAVEAMTDRWWSHKQPCSPFLIIIFILKKTQLCSNIQCLNCTRKSRSDEGLSWSDRIFRMQIIATVISPMRG